MQATPSFKQLINTPKHIVIITHDRPDADALGAGLGLATFLKKKQHQVSVITPSPYPSFLAWMPGNEAVIVASQGQRARSLELVKNADVIFCVDFSSLHRINELGELVKNASATKVVIDHHQNPESFADLYLWDVKAAATAEIVYQTIESLGDEALIDQNIAECLYAGIMTDTGLFKNPNTTATSHLITANLIRKGVDIAKIGRLIYENNSLIKLKFLGFAISHRLVVMKKYNTAYFALKKEDFKEFNLRTGDTEGLVSHALALKGIVLAALIKDKRDAVRISLRSSGVIPVDIWAKEHFEGGGHKNASGGISFLSLEETVAKFEAMVKANQPILTQRQ